MSRSNQPLDPNLTIDPFAIASFTGPDNHTGLFLDADQVNSSVLLRTNDTNAVYVDKFQNIGINTISPAAQLDINAADGKCVQLTYNGSSNKASLQVASDGKLTLIASGGEVSIDTASNFNIKSHDGTSIGLKLNNTLVRTSADQINYNVVTPGTAAASKAIVLDSSRDITNIRNLTASQLTGTIQTASQPNITSVATLDITAHDGSQGLALGGVLLTATAAQLNYNVVTPGTASASKALVVDANKDITSIRNLTASQLTGTLQTAAQPNITSVGTLLGLDIDGSFTGLATLGIATTTAGRTLVVNSDVGNCIQLCYDTTSGAANTYVDMLVSSAGDLTVTASGGNVNISSHNGTDKGLKLGGTLVVSTADQINYLSGSTPGTASGGKALIFDSSRNVDNINNLTASQLTGTLQTASQPNINSVNVLNIANHNGSTLGLRLNSTLVTATATELNYVDTTPGTAEASKALVLDSGGNIAGLTSLSATDLIGTLQTATQTNITSVGTLTSITTSGTFTMGTTVISESEIGVINDVTAGTASASKALVLDSSSDISGINSLSASELTGALQTAAQPNITSVGTLTSITTSGTFTMGSTVISAAEIGVLDDVTPGTATASKALVLDANKDIATIRNLTATNLTGTIQTASQPNITSVATLDITAHNGTTTGLYLGGTLITATAAQINSIFGGSGGAGSFADLTVTGWLDIANANGTTIGLKLDGQLVTASANELNYLSGTNPGYAAIGKALVPDNNLSISNLATLAVSNHLTIDGIDVYAANAYKITNITNGIASAGKALVVDSSVNISGINSLSTNGLTLSATTTTYFTSISYGTGSGSALTSNTNQRAVIAYSPTLQMGIAIGSSGVNATYYAIISNTNGYSSYNDFSSNIGSSFGISINWQPENARFVYYYLNSNASGSADTLRYATSTNGINWSAAGTTGIATYKGTNIVYHTTSATYIFFAYNKFYWSTNGTTTWNNLTITNPLNTSDDQSMDSVQQMGNYVTHRFVVQSGNASNVVFWNDTTWTLSGTISQSTFPVVRAYHPYEDRLYMLPVSPNETASAASVTLSFIDSFSTRAFNTWSANVQTTTLSSINPIENISMHYLPNFDIIIVGNKSSTSDVTNYVSSIRVMRLINKAVNYNLTDGPTENAANIYKIYSGNGFPFASVDWLGNLVIPTRSPGSTINSVFWTPSSNSNGILFGSTTITENKLAVISGVTQGTATASKALVTDNNNRIGGIDTVTATNLAGTIQTAAQPSITSLGTLTSVNVSSSTTTNTFTTNFNSVNNNTITFANTTNGFAGGINITGYNGSGISKNVIRFAPVYGTTTNGSETSGCNFYALAAGTEYTPFQILSTGGCKVTRASANGTVLSVGGAISSANQYGDLAFEGTGVTLLRQRAIYVDSNTSKMELYGRSGGADALMTTFAYGTTGGVLTSLESVTSGRLISTIGSSSIGLQHINNSISIATIIDSSNTRGCFGTTTNHDAYFFTNNRSTNPSLILEAYTNFVKINTNVTGSSGALGSSLGVRGGIQNNCDTVTLNTSTGTCLLGSTALTSPYTVNPWLASQLVPFNSPTSLGFGSMQRGQLFVQAGYFTSTYTETYTFTVTYVYTFYKIWVNGKLLGNNLSINSSSTNTGTFTLALIASTRNSIYIQILPQNATSGSCSLSVSYQSVRQSSTTVPINASNGTEKYISTEPLSCPSVFTIYDQTTASSALLKSELTTNSSGNLNIFASGLTTLIDSTNSFDIAGHNGTTIGLKLGGTLVTATAAQLDYTKASPGTASANKALVVDDNKDIASINSLVAAQLTGAIQTAAQPNITSVGTLSGITTSGTFTMGTTAISEAEIGVIDNVTPGTAAASKALVLDSSLDISGINALSASELTGALQTAAQPNITSVGTLSSITTSGSLTLGATSISEGEIGVLNDVTPGTAAAIKALVLDSSSNISGINSLSATSLTGALQTAAQPNITSVGTLTSITTSGTFTMGSTAISEGEIAVLNGVTAGAASASKALVLDSSLNISGINSLSATSLTGELQTAAQPNVTSVGTLTSITTSGTFTMGTTGISEAEIGVLDGVTPGTATASKALVLDANKDIATIRYLTATQLTGEIQTASQPNITSVGTLTNLVVAGDLECGGNLIIGGTIIAETEIVHLDGATPGTAEALKAMITDASNNIAGINSFSATSLTGTIQTASQPNITSVTTLDITGHNGTSTGLKLGGVLVTATASQLNSIVSGSSSSSFAALTAVDTITITNANGVDKGLVLGSTLVLASAAQLNYNVVTPGTASASKTLVLNSNSDISGINSLSASELTGELQTAAQPNVTSVGTLTSITTSGALTLGATSISESEIGVLDGVTPGTAAASKALVLNSSLDISGINSLSATSLTGELQTAAQPNITSVGTLTSVTTSGALTLGATSISESEIGVLNGVTPGTAAASKALVLDSSSDISGINSLSASELTGELQTAAQPNVTSVGTLTSITTSGTFTMGTTGISEAEIGVLDGVTPGTAAASKALVLDANKDIATIRYLTATQLTGEIQTAAQPNITSVGILTSITTSGSLTMGSTAISESEIGVIDNVTAGSASASKALVLNSSKGISGITSLASTSIAVGSPANSNLPVEIGYTSYQFTGAYAYNNDNNAHGMVDAGNGPSANYSLRADGRILVTGEVEITSDRRLKKDIVALTPELCKSFILTTTPVRFNWKSDDAIPDYGYIAQDVLKAGFNDLVTVVSQPDMDGSVDDDGFINPAGAKYVFSPGKIIPMVALNQRQLFEANDAKDVEIADLKERLSALESLVSQLSRK